MELIELADFIGLLEKNDPQAVLNSLESCEGLVDRIKIKTDTWGTSTALNVHAAQYMQAVQKDVLTAWNAATGQNVTLARLHEYPFLVVSFDMQDGCLNIRQAVKLVGIIVKDLSPKQKMLLYGMIFGGVLAFCSAYIVGKLADSGFFDSDEVRKIKILAQQKESAKVIINNLGNGSVCYHGKDWIAEDLRNDRKKIEAVSATETLALDGLYTIDTCRLEGGIHVIGEDGRNFNADVDSLDEEKRQLLSSRIGDALIQKKKLEQIFRIDAKLKDGAIIKAHIIDIDQPKRKHAASSAASSDQSISPVMKQGNLLDLE